MGYTSRAWDLRYLQYILNDSLDFDLFKRPRFDCFKGNVGEERLAFEYP